MISRSAAESEVSRRRMKRPASSARPRFSSRDVAGSRLRRSISFKLSNTDSAATSLLTSAPIRMTPLRRNHRMVL